MKADVKAHVVASLRAGRWPFSGCQSWGPWQASRFVAELAAADFASIDPTKVPDGVSAEDCAANVVADAMILLGALIARGVVSIDDPHITLPEEQKKESSP